MGRPFEYKGHILYLDDCEDGWSHVRAIDAFEAEEDERVRRILESEIIRKCESQRRFEELSNGEKMLVKAVFEAYYGMSANELATKAKSEVARSLFKKLGVI